MRVNRDTTVTNKNKDLLLGLKVTSVTHYIVTAVFATTLKSVMAALQQTLHGVTSTTLTQVMFRWQLTAKKIFSVSVMTSKTNPNPESVLAAGVVTTTYL